MSQPLGYPDWVRSFATSRLFDVPFNVGTITTPTFTQIYTVVNIDSIGVGCAAIIGHGRLIVEWYADEGATQFITRDVISLREGTVFDQSVVVKGPFVRILASNVAPANWTLDLVIYETTRSVIPQRSINDNILIAQSSVVVAAGATNTTFAIRVVAGPAHWYADTALATWFATIDAIDHLGVVTILDVQRNSAPPARTNNIYLPATTVQARFFNGTAAAGNFNLTLVSAPGLSGM